MTGYFDDLREELVKAAAREGARGRASRRVRRPLIVVMAALALAAVPATAGLTGLWRADSPGPSGPAVPPRAESARIEAQVADPAGGNPWAVRVWRTKENTQACVQLGRLDGERFEAIGRPGRPARFSVSDGARCSATVFDKREPIVAVETFVDDARSGAPRPLQTVVWGLAGPQAREVSIRHAGSSRILPSTARNAFVALYDGDVRTYEIATTVTYRSGAKQTVDYGRARRRGEQPELRSAELEASAPNPGGGAPWGTLVWNNASGEVCSFEGRVIAGGRVGSLGLRTAFFDHPLGEHGGCVDRSQPLAYGVASIPALRGGGKGVTLLHGIARADVAKVTVKAFGEERELEPSRRGAVLAVYDGLRDGRLVAEVTLRDGTKQAVPGLSLGPMPTRSRAQRGLSAVGPRVVRVRRGVATILVSCPSNPKRGKCMGDLGLISAKPYRRSREGLSRHLVFGRHYIRIGRGAERRPLRIRLTRRSLSMLNLRGRVEAFAVERSEGMLGRERRWKVTLVKE